VSVLQRISSENVWTYKHVRLRALQDTPSAFGSTYEREAEFSDHEWIARAARVDGEKAIGYLAMDGREACGVVAAFIDRVDPLQATLVSMWVAPTHRRTGVGRSLVEAVMDWAATRELTRIRLHVTSNNGGAQRFYEELGFVFTGVVEPHKHMPDLIELEMVREV
jgi:ribosomal protein S18 acetylase RimI-like enzyme